MKTTFLTSIVVLGSIGVDAHAACEAPYAAESLGSDLGTMSEALRASDRDVFKRAGKTMTDNLPCVDSPLAPVVLANVYRYAGLSAYFSGDSKRADEWFRTSLELDSSFDWDVKEVPVNDPIRSVFTAQREIAGVEKQDAALGLALVIEDGFRLIADGRTLTEPRLTPGRPHLIQRINTADNTVDKVWLVEGASLPQELLGQKEAVSSEAASQASFDVQKIERSRPPMKTPTLILGGLSVAGGVGMYVLSFQTSKQFEKATTTSQLESKRALTNGLVIGAGGAVVLGSGLTYLGVMLDGGTGLRFGGSF